MRGRVFVVSRVCMSVFVRACVCLCVCVMIFDIQRPVNREGHVRTKGTASCHKSKSDTTGDC